MRTAVARPVLEEHNSSDGLSRRYGDARRRRGAVVRELARMIAERSARYRAPSYIATVPTVVAQCRGWATIDACASNSCFDT